MASTAALGAQALTNAETALAVIKAYGSEERRQRIETYYQVVPSPNQNPIAHAAFQSELIAGLAEMYEALVSQPATPKRGRPKKADA